MIKRKNAVNNIALFIALLFHICGLIGILLTSYRQWFIQNTALNLLLMTMLIIITQPKINKQFFIFFIAAVITGLTVEIIGVNTTFLFGSYTYGNMLEVKLFGVPVIIGFNWFMIMYCIGIATQFYEDKLIKRMHDKGFAISKQLQVISFVTDAALLAVLFDWVMEPAAIKLGFWQWHDNAIPFYNYLCWLICSALLLALFKRLQFNKHNIFAVHLLIIQFLFFFILRTFL